MPGTQVLNLFYPVKRGFAILARILIVPVNDFDQLLLS